MKPKTTIAIAAVAGLLGIGAAAVTLPAEAPSAQTATATPEVRTEVVHRHHRSHHRRHRAAAVATPAPVAATPAAVVVRDDDDDHGRHHGDDDRGFEDHSGHGGHGRDHAEDD